MSSATLVFQKSKKPLIRGLALLFVMYGLLATKGWYEAIINDRVLQPFLMLLAAPFLFALFRRENPVRPLVACFVPAGVAVGALNLIEPLLTLEDAGNAIASPTLYGPIGLGLILSYACRAVTPHYEPKAGSTGVVGVLVCLMATVTLFSAHVVSTLDSPSVYLINFLPLITTLGVILCTFSYNEKARLAFGEVMARGGLFTCLLAAVHAVTLYTAGVAANEPRILGPVLVNSFNLLAYGALLVISGSAVSASEDRALMTRDWHLTEAYVFVTLIVFPPMTLLEFISGDALGVVGDG